MMNVSIVTPTLSMPCQLLPIIGCVATSVVIVEMADGRIDRGVNMNTTMV